jgi:hypothetical protein
MPAPYYAFVPPNPWSTVGAGIRQIGTILAQKKAEEAEEKARIANQRAIELAQPGARTVEEAAAAGLFEPAAVGDAAVEGRPRLKPAAQMPLTLQPKSPYMTEAGIVMDPGLAREQTAIERILQSQLESQFTPQKPRAPVYGEPGYYDYIKSTAQARAEGTAAGRPPEVPEVPTVRPTLDQALAQLATEYGVVEGDYEFDPEDPRTRFATRSGIPVSRQWIFDNATRMAEGKPRLPEPLPVAPPIRATPPGPMGPPSPTATTRPTAQPMRPTAAPARPTAAPAAAATPSPVTAPAPTAPAVKLDTSAATPEEISGAADLLELKPSWSNERRRRELARIGWQEADVNRIMTEFLSRKR